MISFMLVAISLKVVAIAALVGLVLSCLFHYALGSYCKKNHNGGCCKKSNDGCCKSQECASGSCAPNYQKHDQNMMQSGFEQRQGMNHHAGHPSLDEHDYCCKDCNIMCMALYKVIGFALKFVQAYALAFFIERFNLLGDYKNAIALTIFIAIAFVLTEKVACTMWRKKSWTHCLLKTAGCFVVLCAMSAVIVYLS